MRLPATNRRGRLLRALGVMAVCGTVGCTVPLRTVVEAGWLPEQQTIPFRDPAPLPPVPIPNIPPPVTVADKTPAREPWNLSLDEAIRVTLENAKAIRVFTGLGATNSGRTIYDAAIATTAIDQQQARFDPALTADVSYNRTESPVFGPVLNNPLGIDVIGSRLDVLRRSVGLTKTNTVGGQLGLNAVGDTARLSPGGSAANPTERRALELSYTQPLLQGGGFQFNTAPIVLARIDTERSYFQFKDATQDLVRGTIEAYWNLVFARLAVWATEIQYEQADEAYKIARARRIGGLGDAGTEAQSRVTFNQFRASLIAARADALDREAALRNVIGLPPADGRTLVPTSAPANLRFQPEWEKLLRFAEQRRPDIVELKLILEADAQRKIQAENSALPRLDATALYRWHGLSGRLPPFGERVSSDPGQFTDWTVGATFSVPLGLREGRARVRDQDLIILRDRANLEQGLHAAGHDLALTVRQLESAYEQYVAYRETRAAAFVNLDLQINRFRVGTVIFLNVLQALNDWGNAIRSEARALTDYNILLATLERQTGTILETHGLVFVEERFRAVGPLCLPEHDCEYPQDLKPVGEPTKYPATGQPGENAFDLKKPEIPKDKPDGPSQPKPKPKFAEDRPK
ncbi:MAG TPA: TolC family protein [Gemmataceae bacterium]|nr:TolC family protein [Gemmataceae bacterium]